MVQPYPLFVNMAGARVLVVGAGKVASRKIDVLLDHGATVDVVAPEALPEVQALADSGRIRWDRRRWQPADLHGALLVVAATSDRAVNEAVHREASVRAMLVNVVDVPELCNCIVPSILERGRLQVAVSTGGAAPSLARAIRHDLEELFGAWWEPYLDTLADVRLLVKERVEGPTSARTRLFEALASRDVRDRFAEGERPTPEELYCQVVEPLLEVER